MLNIDALTAFCQAAGAQIETDVPFSSLTTFKVGGPCAALITVPNAETCQKVFGYLREHQIPHDVIGRGSNLLVPDSGYAGAAIRLGGKLAEEIREADGIVTCGAGVSLKNLCLFALDHCLTGLEFAYGIPGSVGGAVCMNAGAYDGEISRVLLSVNVLDEEGAIRMIPAEELDLRYRHSIFMERSWIVLSASFCLEFGNQDEIRAKMQDLLGRRKAKQPLEYPSAGSTFKRPIGNYASKLIDECGLRGFTIGGAQVSEKHAGFVINRGGATFADIMAVCDHVRETVRTQTGYELELEPEILQTEE